MPTGYTPFTARDIREADERLLGVQLGRICLDKGIPASDVAEYLNVSRVTVYKWFKGTVDVSYKHADRVANLVKQLS